jgi:phage/plasmid-associated DNA primase
VLAATRKYEHNSDVLARFLDDESVIVRGHGSVRSGQLYKHFQEWARSQGEPTEMTNKAFTARWRLLWPTGQAGR